MGLKSYGIGFVIILVSVILYQKDELKEVKAQIVYIKKVASADATKERVYEGMNTKIEKDYNEKVTGLDNSDVIDFGN